MKKLIVAIVLLISFSAYGQSPDFVRTKKVNDQNVVDARPKAYLSLNIPHFPTWTLNGAKDSTAYIMYNTTLNKFGVYVGGGIWKEYATVEELNLKVDKVTGKSLLDDTEIIRLSGIATGATANSTDAALRDRTTHTGVQGIGTVTGLQAAIDLKANLAGATFTGDLQAPAIPATSTSVITKSFLDNALTGITWKNAVRMATTANIVLSGIQTIDGVAGVANNRILVKNQTDQIQNGPYVMLSGAWTRVTDADEATEIETSTMAVTLGTLNKNTQWTCLTSNITIGTTPINFGQISGAGTYVNGNGLTLTGNVFAVDNTVATLAGTQTLTNKTISGATNTITNIPDVSLSSNINLLNAAQTVTGLKTFSGGLNTNLTTGSVPFVGAAGLLTQDNSQLFWDNTNKRLGIGIAIPLHRLDVNGTVRLNGDVTANGFLSTSGNNGGNTIKIGTITGYGGLWINQATPSLTNYSFLGGGPSNDIIVNSQLGAKTFFTENNIVKLTMFPTSGNFVFQNGGTFTDAGFRLDVNGTGRFQNRLTLATGTSTIAPLNIPTGVLTTTPVSGNIENDGVNFSYTDNTATRRTMVNLVGAQTLQNKTFGAGNTWQGNIIAPAFLGIGTANASTFLSGDGIYKAVPLEYTISTKTANFAETATAGMVIIKGDTNTAGFTITLPSAVGNKSTIVIKKTAALNTLTVNTTLSQTIDTSLTAVLTRQHESITLVSDNTNWIII